MKENKLLFIIKITIYNCFINNMVISIIGSMKYCGQYSMNITQQYQSIERKKRKEKQ